MTDSTAIDEMIEDIIKVLGQRVVPSHAMTFKEIKAEFERRTNSSIGDRLMYDFLRDMRSKGLWAVGRRGREIVYWMLSDEDK
jgi:hypothetical protein